MNKYDRAAVAQRLRGLLGGQDAGNVEATAERLGIEEVSLRMSIDEESPHPTVEVLAAVIRVYGVDPTWLLTGVYNGVTHRSAMEGVSDTAAALRDWINKSPARIAEPTQQNIRLHED